MLLHYSKNGYFNHALQWSLDNSDSMVMLGERDLNELLYHMSRYIDNQDMETLFKFLVSECIIDLSQWDIIGAFTNSITENTLKYLLTRGVPEMFFYGWIGRVLQRLSPVRNFETEPEWFTNRLDFWVRSGIRLENDEMINILERALRYRNTQKLVYKLVDIFGDIVHYSDDYYLLLCIKGNVDLSLIQWLVDERGLQVETQNGDIILHAISYAEPSTVELLLSRINWKKSNILKECWVRANNRRCRKIIKMIEKILHEN